MIKLKNKWNSTFFPKRVIWMDLLFAYGIPFARVFRQVHFTCFCDLYKSHWCCCSILSLWLPPWKQSDALKEVMNSTLIVHLLGINPPHLKCVPSKWWTGYVLLCCPAGLRFTVAILKHIESVHHVHCTHSIFKQIVLVCMGYVYEMHVRIFRSNHFLLHTV